MPCFISSDDGRAECVILACSFQKFSTYCRTVLLLWSWAVWYKSGIQFYLAEVLRQNFVAGYVADVHLLWQNLDSNLTILFQKILDSPNVHRIVCGAWMARTCIILHCFTFFTKMLMPFKCVRDNASSPYTCCIKLWVPVAFFPTFKQNVMFTVWSSIGVA